MIYTPRPGSVPDRAIQVLEAFGQPMPGKMLADELAVAKKNLRLHLDAAVRHGAIKREFIHQIVHYGMPNMTFNVVPPSEWGPPGKKAEPNTETPLVDEAVRSIIKSANAGRADVKPDETGFTYGYQSNGTFTIRKADAHIVLTPEQCEEIADFIDVVIPFHKRIAK